MYKKKKPSTYAKYKRASDQLARLLEFMHYDNHLLDQIRLGDVAFRVSKLQDGSTNVERIET